MANPSIVFDDGSGSTTLTCVVPRFGNWIPEGQDIGPNESALGTGAVFQWAFRRDYWASFEMPNIPPASLGDLIRLKLWLMAGGSITVNTADLAARSYTCTLKPGTVPAWTFDRQMLEYTLQLSVLNASAAPMLCEYK